MIFSLRTRVTFALCFLLASGLLLAGTVTTAAAPAGREQQDFDDGWRFHLGDNGYSDTTQGTLLTGWQWRPAGDNHAAPPTDDAAWQPAVIGADVFDRKPGFAWYQTTFPTPTGRAVLHFGAVDDNADVFVNGTKLLHHEGYADPFDVNTTAVVKPDSINTVEVLVENGSGTGSLSQEVFLQNPTARPAPLTGPALPDFADATWRSLRLPHDWMIEGVPGADPSSVFGPFDRNSPGGGGNGYLNGGVGWYRKTFTVPASEKGRRAFLLFDGVYMDSDVWLNGVHLGSHPYGYTSFGYDLTPHLKYGAARNVLSVRCNVHQPASRFYSGAGIYRHVHLIVTNPVHVPVWGTYVTTPRITTNAAQVTVRTRVQNDGATPAPVTLVSSVLAPDGRKHLVSVQTMGTLAAGQGKEFAQTLSVPRPRLWSTTDPALHTLRTEVRVNGTVADTYNTLFGIRTLAFTKDNGFLLNGKRVQIHGVCDHHDLGALGAAVNARAMQRQLEILHSFGCNALRTSHYPPDPELLTLCDKMGFLVMDEAFDEWKASKTTFGYGRFFDAWSERDIVSMTHRDRNHPSVILWSIGNEINEQGAANGFAMSKRLADFVRREDPTRFVTSAMSNPEGAVRSGFATPLDVFGVNYHPYFYNSDLAHGKWPMIGSETASALNSRGEYGLSLDAGGKVVINLRTADNQLPGYDVIRPGWGNTAEESLKAVRDAPWVAGEFVWTGFDYIGEPTPYGWPSRSSYFGIVDLCGFPKDRYYLYKSQWTQTPVVHLLPQKWNWPGWEGKSIPVWVYTNADSVELFLNGKSLGTQAMKDTTNLHLEFSVPFAPGVLRAVGTKNGKPFAADEVRTAGAPAKLELVPDRASFHADGHDLSFVQVRVLDANGTVCPDADAEVKFTVSGPGTIAGTDNGDATNLEFFQKPQHKAFHGLALAIVQSTGRPGPVRLSASAEGLQGASATLQSR